MAFRPRLRFFFISDKHLDYREIRWFHTKFSLVVGLATVLLVTATFVVNQYYYDFLGLGFKRIQTLTQENEVLKQRVKKFAGQMVEIEKTLEDFNDRTNELRLLVDLPTIDEDTRLAGVGGRSASTEFGVSSIDAQDLLSSSTVLLDRISREIQLQRMSYDEVYKRYQFNEEFFACIPALKPMDGYYSASGFGLRMHPVLGVYKTHDGLDIIADVGMPVYASGKGVIEYASHSGGGYGRVVLINHGYGYQSLYAHLSKINVREGQQIKRGDLMGYSGKTGLVSGPHLHYEVRYRGVRQNPIDYFLDDVAPQNYRTMALVSQ